MKFQDLRCMNNGDSEPDLWESRRYRENNHSQISPSCLPGSSAWLLLASSALCLSMLALNTFLAQLRRGPTTACLGAWNSFCKLR